MTRDEAVGVGVLVVLGALVLTNANRTQRRQVVISGGAAGGGGTNITTPWGSYKQGPGGFTISIPNLGGPSAPSPDPGLASPGPSPDYTVQDPTAPAPTVPADVLPDYGAGLDAGADPLTPDLVSGPPSWIAPDPTMFVDPTTSADLTGLLSF